MEAVITALLEQNAKLTEQIVELSRIIAEQRPEPEVYIPTPMRTYPLHVPESEEDARVAYESGEITKEQLQEVLQEVEFFNSEITVPTPGL